jgi:hypothetical protein
VIVLRGRVTLPQTATFRFGLARLPIDQLQALAAIVPSDPRPSLGGT